MFWMKQQSRQEHIIYLALWGILFVSPLFGMYVRSMSDSSYQFEWEALWMIWTKFLVFLLLFLVHNFLLAPLLVFAHKRLLYFSLTAAIVAAFAFYQCTTRPVPPKPRHHQMEHCEHRPPTCRHQAPEPHGDALEPHDDAPDHRSEPRHIHRVGPPAGIGEHDIAAVVILVLMFGMNIAVKGFAKSRQEHRKLLRLEKENLTQQLEYLKYQINPHFFMNTLNNIHALVDIDPEKAKDTILELSKMMRFILYEGDKNGVPLTKEFEFIRTYIQLMRLRYTDRVTIAVDLPTEVPDKTVPPLMLISFIENAFKHGISYQHPSFIEVSVVIEHPANLDTQLRFTCRNSKAETPNSEKGGVGLANVRKRLNLLYDNNYTLKIRDDADSYQVELAIPLG